MLADDGVGGDGFAARVRLVEVAVPAYALPGGLEVGEVVVGDAPDGDELAVERAAGGGVGGGAGQFAARADFPADGLPDGAEELLALCLAGCRSCALLPVRWYLLCPTHRRRVCAWGAPHPVRIATVLPNSTVLPYN